MTADSRFPPAAIGALSSSLLSHAASLAIYRLWTWELDLFFGFRGVILFLVAASAALSVLAFLAAGRGTARVALALRVTIAIVVVYSFGPYLFTGVPLIVGLLLELNAYEPFPTNLIADVAVLLAWVLFHRAGARALGGTAPRWVPDVVVTAICLVPVGVSSAMAARYRRRLAQKEAEAQRLDAAVVGLTRTQFGYLEMANTARERSAMEERNRIIREIHDTIGYTLTNVSMMIEAARDLAKDGSPRLHETLLAARSQAQQGLDDTRRSLYLLRSRETGAPIGLTAIQRMVRTFTTASGIDVEVEYGNLPPSSGEEMDAAIFHFIQEGLINAFRHGHATAIRILLWIDREDYHLVLRDNGVGSESFKEGIGMTGMRERIGRLGGTFSAGNVADGFEVRATIPAASGEPA